MPVISEIGDAPSGVTTPYGMPSGFTFSGSIGSPGDTDWVRLYLAPGTYFFDLNGQSIAGDFDPLMSLHNAAGGVLATSSGLWGSGHTMEAHFTYTVTTAGWFYMSATDAGSATGNYGMIAVDLDPANWPLTSAGNDTALLTPTDD